MPDQWDVPSYCTLLEEEIATLGGVVTDAALRLHTPTCPGWSVSDVVLRTGEMFQWVSAMVRNDSVRRPGFGHVDLNRPHRTADYVKWMADCGHELLSEFRVLDPEKPLWSWGAEQSLRFWARRAHHDTSIHRADVQIALGHTPGFSAAIAADGIEEFLDILLYAGHYSARIARIRGRGEKIALVAPLSSWTIELTPNGYEWRRGDDGDADVTATAEVADLLLMLWGRREPTDPRIRVTGRAKVLDRWAELSAMA